MRRLAVFLCLTLTVLSFSTTTGESADFRKGKNLPPCSGNYNKNAWNNCEGTATYADGSQYFGEWKNGKYHGQGIKTYTDGRIETGKWENNEYIGSEKFRVNSIHELLQAENNRVRFGTQADPSTVTLGPTDGGIPRYPPYDGKNSLNFKMPLMTAVLAPLDLQFVGFKNRSAHYRHNLQPYDDLELCFESVSPEWLGPEFSVPTTKWAGINVGLVLCVYHLHTTPLLRGHLKHEACSIQEKWTGDGAKKGRVYYLDNTHIFRVECETVQTTARIDFEQGRHHWLLGSSRKQSACGLQVQDSFNRVEPANYNRRPLPTLGAAEGLL